MSGRSVELGGRGDTLVIRFPFDTTVVSVIRGLSARRFDQHAKYWACPIETVVEVVDTLLPHDFEIGASVREVYGSRGGTQRLAATPAKSGSLPPPRCTAPAPAEPTTARPSRSSGRHERS
jgi:hypothetical protein